MITSITTIILVSFFLLILIYSLKIPIVGTDALKYGNLGKILFNEKSLAYRWISPYPETGYYFDINHAPSFSLLLTWEKIMESFFRKNKDLYYKSICPYYAFLILILLVFWLSKENKYLALLAIFLLLTGFSFLHTIASHHLDFYRIFFLVISWIYLAYAVEKKDSLSFFLLGVFSGFAAFSHTIGAVLVTVNCLALFIFLKGNLKYKLTKTGFVVLLIIIFGWLHYILDIFWGYGWLIFNRRITFWG